MDQQNEQPKRGTSGFYDDPTKYYQGVHVPTGETYQDWLRWWRALCAEMDSKPKHIVRNERRKK